MYTPCGRNVVRAIAVVRRDQRGYRIGDRCLYGQFNRNVEASYMKYEGLTLHCTDLGMRIDDCYIITPREYL